MSVSTVYRIFHMCIIGILATSKSVKESSIFGNMIKTQDGYPKIVRKQADEQLFGNTNLWKGR